MYIFYAHTLQNFLPSLRPNHGRPLCVTIIKKFVKNFPPLFKTRLVTTRYLLVTSRYLLVTTRYLLVTTRYYSLLLVPTFRMNGM